MIDSITMWHSRARPNPNEREMNVQLGCHLEEIAEMLEVLDSDIPETRNALSVLQLLTSRLADQLKLGTASVSTHLELNPTGFSGLPPRYVSNF